MKKHIAAEQGMTEAEFKLGFMYDRGRGVPQNDTETVVWYRKAAEQGHAIAQTNIGIMYAGGRGVPHDDIESIAWLRRGAAQGHAGAQFNLPTMNAFGRGLSKNFVEACAWFALANTNGYDAKAQLDRCSGLLTPSDLKAAKARSAELARMIEGNAKGK